MKCEATRRGSKRQGGKAHILLAVGIDEFEQRSLSTIDIVPEVQVGYAWASRAPASYPRFEASMTGYTAHLDA